MGLFNLVFDELGKEIKEAPGWLLFVSACNLLLFLPGVRNELEHMDVSKEETTVATLVAMALFFLGDVLDSFVFPRERDGKRVEKILKGSMLVLGAFAVFLFLVGRWWYAGGLALLWILIIPIYDTHNRPLQSGSNGCIETKTPQKKAAEPEESDDDVTGFEWLVLQYNVLKDSKRNVRNKLNIDRGIYTVSQAVAKKATKYTISIWFPNEAAKFVRSAVFPTFIASLWLLVDGYKWLAALLVLASPTFLVLYCWLKGLHMRKLYDLVIGIVDQKGLYSSPEPCHGVRLFLWDGDVADCVRVSS